MSFFQIALILSVTILSGQAIGQNYQTINSSQVNYFGTSNLDYILATRTDSVELDGLDSVFYSYKTYRSINVSEGYAGASWIGNSVRIKPNGDNIFLNESSEEITIKTQASLNDTFVVYTYPNSSIIYGTITSVDTMTILGALDSVKVLELFSSESFLLDQEEFVLSKNHGFVKVFPFFYFPEPYKKSHYTESLITEINAPITLVGSTFPHVGITMITKAHMYTMAPNDQVRYHHDHYCYMPMQGNLGGAEYKHILTVTDRTDYGVDSIQFSVEDVHVDEVGNSCWSDQEANSFTIYNTDELVDTYLPEELHRITPNDNTEVMFNTMNYADNCGKLTLRQHINKGSFWLANDTFQHYSIVTRYDEDWIEGFGKITTNGNILLNNPSRFAYFTESIYYTSLNGDVCGDLTLNAPEQIDENLNLTIYPNPSNGFLKIISTEPMDKISIVDLAGKAVFEMDVNGFETQLELNDLTSGVYLVKVISGNEISTERMIMK